MDGYRSQVYRGPGIPAQVTAPDRSASSNPRGFSNWSKLRPHVVRHFARHTGKSEYEADREIPTARPDVEFMQRTKAVMRERDIDFKRASAIVADEDPALQFAWLDMDTPA